MIQEYCLKMSEESLLKRIKACSKRSTRLFSPSDRSKATIPNIKLSTIAKECSSKAKLKLSKRKS